MSTTASYTHPSIKASGTLATLLFLLVFGVGDGAIHMVPSMQFMEGLANHPTGRSVEKPVGTTSTALTTQQHSKEANYDQFYERHDGNGQLIRRKRLIDILIGGVIIWGGYKVTKFAYKKGKQIYENRKTAKNEKESAYRNYAKERDDEEKANRPPPIPQPMYFPHPVFPPFIPPPIIPPPVFYPHILPHPMSRFSHPGRDYKLNKEEAYQQYVREQLERERQVEQMHAIPPWASPYAFHDTGVYNFDDGEVRYRSDEDEVKVSSSEENHRHIPPPPWGHHPKEHPSMIDERYHRRTDPRGFEEEEYIRRDNYSPPKPPPTHSFGHPASPHYQPPMQRFHQPQQAPPPPQQKQGVIKNFFSKMFKKKA